LRTRDIIRGLLVDDLRRPLSERVYQKNIAANTITDAALREFGILVLEQYNQEPLIRKLDEIVAQINCPIVIDAARDISDFTSLLQIHDAPILWFVDAPESAIRNRLEQRQKKGNWPIGTESRIDQKAAILKTNARRSLKNESSLEDLRWRVDDALFETIQLERS
jgi:hypothetical protein